MVHGVVRPKITQPLLSPPCYNTCGINLVLLTACILTTNLQIAICIPAVVTPLINWPMWGIGTLKEHVHFTCP